MSEVPIRTLIVDDVEAYRFLIRHILERDGRFEVVAEATDGAKGVEAAKRHQPQLVLLDLSMPVMDGLEALPRILQVCSKATVIVLSGFLEDRLGEPAKELGAASYVEKGAEPPELLQAIVTTLNANGACL
ncbi:MAG: response regulator transcription factor [Candidatus Thermoplasmatota archaeon]|nr:response regulator transcription factor [Candidatus Thermoplasmatota archaeon]